MLNLSHQYDCIHGMDPKVWTDMHSSVCVRERYVCVCVIHILCTVTDSGWIKQLMYVTFEVMIPLLVTAHCYSICLYVHCFRRQPL